MAGWWGEGVVGVPEEGGCVGEVAKRGGLDIVLFRSGLKNVEGVCEDDMLG